MTGPEASTAAATRSARIRKSTNVLVLLFAGLIVLIVIAAVAMTRPQKISVVLEQMLTNAAGEKVHTFKLQNEAWDFVAVAELLTPVPPNEYRVRRLPWKSATGLVTDQPVLKKGDTADLSWARPDGDQSSIVIHCTKENVSPFYRRMAFMNRKARERLTFLPELFRVDEVIALDLNALR